MRPGWSKPKAWSSNEEAYLREFYPSVPVRDLAERMGRTDKSIKSRAKKLKLCWSRGRMRETQFKKGQRSQNYLPVGTIKANWDGYLRIKVSDIPHNGAGAHDKNWEFVHKRVWEAAHGPIPKGHRIWWKDGNHENCALENLELLSDKEHMARTTVHTLPKDLVEVIQLKGALKRRIRRIEDAAGHTGVAKTSV
ncbi:MAG: HNH endonuclease signature motif containing protein [Candidatus Acidiferrum sp.]